MRILTTNEYEPGHCFVRINPPAGSSIELAPRVSQRDEVRSFVVIRYASLMAELSTSTGEDLSALMTMLRIDPAHQAVTRRTLKGLARVHQDQAVFATHVSDLFE